jgi:hypothetical protein
MVSRLASVPGYCCWIAAASLAVVALPASGLPDLAAQSKGSSSALAPVAADLRSLDGLSIVPTWSELGRRASESRVTVRVGRSASGADDFLEMDVRLVSRPTRTVGPDDDRAGANPDEVHLRASRIICAGTVVIEFSTFDSLYEDADGQISGGPRPNSAPSAAYAAARREYVEGRSGPAYFSSRCLIRLPFSSITSAVQKAAIREPGREPILQVRLSTDAGPLNVIMGPKSGEPPSHLPDAPGAAESTVPPREPMRMARRIRIWN